jgi:lysophospholipase L1-like esterase
MSGTRIGIKNVIGNSGGLKSPVFRIADMSVIVNGYFVDSSGNGKRIQAATTAIENDSLIMPANDRDIILALKKIGEYSKYYTSDSSPKTVLIRNISQVSRIQSAPVCSNLTVGETYNVKKDTIIHNGITYGVGSSFVAVNTLWLGVGMVVKGLDNASFFNAKNKTNFYLFNRTQTEAECQILYANIFDYFPITQDADAFSIYLGTNPYPTNIIIDWDDDTTPETKAIGTSDTLVSHTYTARTGLTKNIKITSNADKIRYIYATSASLACTFYVSNLTVLNNVQTASAPLLSITGEIKSAIINNFSSLILASNGLSTIKTTLLSPSRWTKIGIYQPSMADIAGSFGNFVFTPTMITSNNKIITYNGGTLTAINANLEIKNNWPTEMVDAFLITLAASSPTVTSKTLDLRGSNQGRSSASDSAVTTLQGKGWTVLTSNGWIFRGDSITRGSQTSDPVTKRWPYLLCANKGKVELNHGNDGQALCRTTGYQSTIEKEYVYTPSTKIFIAYGVNDAFANNSFPGSWTTTEFLANLESIILYLIYKKNWLITEIVLVSCTYATNATLLARLPNYNAVIQSLAIKYGIQYCDVYTYMMNNGGASLLADGTHPNDAGHQVIANYMIANVS